MLLLLLPLFEALPELATLVARAVAPAALVALLVVAGASVSLSSPPSSSLGSSGQHAASCRSHTLPPAAASLYPAHSLHATRA